MWNLTIKNLLRDKGRLLISLGGVAAMMLLVLLLEGVFAGASEQIVAYPKNAGADVWVVQEGVSNMHMATSVVPRALTKTVQDVPGVARVTPILYVNSLLQIGERRWFSYIVGIEDSAPDGGPWAMAKGMRVPAPGEAVLPEVLAQKAGIGLGDQVTIMGQSYQVVGLSQESFSLANSITFISYDDLEEMLGAKGIVSFLLVKGQPGVSPQVLAERIRQRVPGINSMSRDEFIASDREMSRQMGVDVIQVMTLVGSVVAALVIGLTVYTATLRRAREYGIAKALGAKNLQLMALVATQALVLALMGFVLALALAYAAKPVVQALVPEVALLYPMGSLLKLLLIAMGIAAVASLAPASRIANIEPAVVFKE